MDIALALLPSLLFGLIGIIIMLLGGDSRQQSLGELLGAFIVAVVTLPFLGMGLTWAQTGIAFISGVLLGMGVNYQIRAYHVLGVSRTMPITTGAQLIGISLMGVLLFGEWQKPGVLPVGLAALGLVVVGTLLTSWTEKLPFTPDSAQTINWRRGLILVGISTVGLIAYLILLRWFDIDPLQAFFPQACGFLVTGFILTSPRFTPEFGPTDTRWSKYTARQIITGLIWGTGLIILQYSMATVGVATGFTLSQLGVIISTLGGIFILKERRSKKEVVVIVVGIAILVAGAVLIGVAKGMDA